MTQEALAQSTQQESGLIQPMSELDIITQINKAIAENTTASDIRISRVAIAQPLTPEVAKEMPGWRAGMLFDNLTKEIISTDGKPPWLLEKGVKADDLKAVHYLPVALNFKLPSEYIKWNSKEDQEKGADRWEFKTLEPKDPRVVAGVWKSQGGTFEGKKPPVTINTNYMLLALDLALKMPLGYFRVVSCSRSSAACGQTIASILQAQSMQNQKPWDRVFYLYTQRIDEPQTHYVLQIARGPLLKDAMEPFVSQMCFDMGKALVGPDGKIFQTMIINAAELEGSEHVDATGVSSGNSTGTQSATEDPFSAPVEGEVTGEAVKGF